MLLPLFFDLKKDLIIFDNSSNQTNYSIYKNLMTSVEFLHAIATVIEESVLNKIHKSSS